MSGSIACSIEEVLPTIEPEPELRSSRGFSSCHQVGSRVVVVGAIKEAREQAEVRVYDFRTNSWNRTICTGSRLPYSFCHASFLADDRLYLHGGQNARRYAPLADLYSLDLITFEWTKCKTSSVRPSARSWHCGEYLDRRGVFVMFGGLSGGGDMGDLWILRLEDLDWKKVLAKGVGPFEGYGYSCCAVGETIFFYGSLNPIDGSNDLYMLDCRDSRFAWSKVLTQFGNYRCYASLTVWKGAMVLFGGYDENYRHCSDVFVLQKPEFVPAKAELVLDSYDASNYKCIGHTAVVVDDEIYVFDGRRDYLQDGRRNSFNPLRLRIR